MFNHSLTPQQMFIGAVCFLFILLIVIVVPAKKNYANPYKRLDSILTPAEQHFYKVLSSAIHRRAIIMAKVRVADLLNVRKSIKQKHFWSYYSKISQKHLDFVLIDTQTFSTLCVIELDDKSHARPERILRDRFLNQVLEDVGISLFRFRVKRKYNHTEILETLNRCLPQ